MQSSVSVSSFLAEAHLEELKNGRFEARKELPAFHSLRTAGVQQSQRRFTAMRTFVAINKLIVLGSPNFLIPARKYGRPNSRYGF